MNILELCNHIERLRTKGAPGRWVDGVEDRVMGTTSIKSLSLFEADIGHIFDKADRVLIIDLVNSAQALTSAIRFLYRQNELSQEKWAAQANERADTMAAMSAPVTLDPLSGS